jgi:hypothetical protein
MDSKKVFWLPAGAAVIWFAVSVITSGNDAHRGAEDAASGLKDLQDKYGDGENGAGAENGNKWVYRTRNDAMRSQRHLFATETSTNAEFMGSGINGNSRMRWVRKMADPIEDVYITIPDGQFHCAIGRCHISVKFDDKPVKDFDAIEPTDGSSDTLFIVTSLTFLNELKASKKAIIEAPFYQDGRRQFTFNTMNLHWPPTKQDLAE